MKSIFLITSLILLQNSMVNAGLFNLPSWGKTEDIATANPKDKKLLEDFECPDTGDYPMSGEDNCNRYYHCSEGDKKHPTKLKDCEGSKLFNRISRSCEAKKLVNCDFCEKKGRIADITSKSHFFVCSKQLVATRYKCKDGNYDVKEKKCENIKEEFDPEDSDHAKKDEVKDIENFEENWREKEKENKGKDKDKKD